MAFFEKMTWLTDRLLLNNLVFRLEYDKNDATWDLKDECLLLIKDKELMDSYHHFFLNKKSNVFNHVFEIGMYTGGSIALWYEILQPLKIVGVDFDNNKENDYFRRYVASNGLSDKIKTYWNTDQAESAKLRQIAIKEFPKGIDLVFDDASHMYQKTKQSFEALFPLLNPGGLYIIEDWNWSHMPAFQRPNSIWMNEMELTRLVFDLVEAVGSSRYGGISNLHIFYNYVVIEKSPCATNMKDDFQLEKVIARRKV